MHAIITIYKPFIFIKRGNLVRPAYSLEILPKPINASKSKYPHGITRDTRAQ